MSFLILAILFSVQAVSNQDLSKTSMVTSSQQAPIPTSADVATEDHKLVPDDIVDVAVFEVPELSGSFRVSASGFLSLPLIGTMKAAGLDTNDVARQIEEALRQKYIKDPHVTVGIKEYMTSSVSVMGAVRLPGVQPMKNSKPLMDVIAGAGGLLDAGSTLQVIRGNQVTTIVVEDLFQNGKTELNIPVYGGDVVNVLPAMSVFIVGEVAKPGEYPLKFGKGLTVRQAIAVGGGFTKTPNKKESKIIRYHSDGRKEEIPLNLVKIMDASTEDQPMMPNDILWIPSSRAKNAASRTLDVAIGVASSRLVWMGR